MHLPLATYRIQFNANFGFSDAKKILQYLADLGISDLYASPIFKAVKGSNHGYDVVDPNLINPELGGIEEFESLVAKLKNHHLFWLQDIVPNHMAYNSDNLLLLDVLENGEKSPFYNFFDIEWTHTYAGSRGRLLAPFLGNFYGEALDKGEIKLHYGENGLAVRYYDNSFPLNIESYQKVFTLNLSQLEQTLGKHHPELIKFVGTVYTFNSAITEADSIKRTEQICSSKKMLWQIYNNNIDIKNFIDQTLSTYNGQAGNPQSFNLLDELLTSQRFRLSFWKVATEEINYRRFFNINQLISLKAEDENVFAYTHELIFKLIAENKISGLRIDHIDGLYAPTKYLELLKQKTNNAYIIVEKILELKERLPDFWPIEGTTGYDFLNYVNGLFCQRRNERKFNRIYAKHTHQHLEYDDFVSDKKRLIIGKHMAGDIDNLAHLMKRISGIDRYGRDITLYGLRRALVEIMAFFPVYRTYIDEENFSRSDQNYIKDTINKAKQRAPGLFYELSFIEKFLLLEFADLLNESEKKLLLHFVQRFQQFTGPLMAKGFEDTFLYIYNRLISLNDVGSNPGKFGISIKEFHLYNKKRGLFGLNCTSTHDTKRGEDVRARINVLSEIPDQWEAKLKLWRKINRDKKALVNKKNKPDENDEYFLYQTLLGAWPFDPAEIPEFGNRLKEYIIKAVREAKVHTAWLKPDSDYESTYLSFVDKLLWDSDDNLFLNDFKQFQKKIAFYGIFNSLSQTLLKIAAPGVPDFYQGTELWDLNLVDPDNRRPIDFSKRQNYLNEIKTRSVLQKTELIKDLLANKEDGRLKLFLIFQALQARNTHADIFLNSTYVPLEISGKHKEHIIGFARKLDQKWLIILVPRFLTSLIQENVPPLGNEIWEDTQLILPTGAPRNWQDIFTDQKININEHIQIGQILNQFPVAMLKGDL
ncbi:MAG: malto-oligosyltrehalose synthase [Pseudomonadota bacterium]